MAKKSREEIDHYVLDQFEQEKHLGIGHEMTRNLGHTWRESEIEKNPAGRMMNYDTAPTEKTFADPPRLQGVYKKTADPQSGHDLEGWSKRAAANSYHRGPGPGKEPTMRDPRGRHSNESDGYLLSTKRWANLPDSGADSGPGRIEKAKRY